MDFQGDEFSYVSEKAGAQSAIYLLPKNKKTKEVNDKKEKFSSMVTKATVQNVSALSISNETEELILEDRLIYRKKEPISDSELGRLAKSINYKKIQFVDVSQNQLRKVPMEIFKYMNQLKRVSVANNKIRCLPDTFIDWFPKLEHLDVSHNRITQINNVFESTRPPCPIYSLNISSNPINEIRIIPEKLERMRILNIDATEVSELPLGLRKLKSLETLWLSWSFFLGQRQGDKFTKLTKVSIQNLFDFFEELEGKGKTSCSFLDFLGKFEGVSADRVDKTVDVLNRTLLHQAVVADNPGLALFLGRNYPQLVRQKDKNGSDPFGTALKEKKFHIVKVLLTLDVDPNSYMDRFGSPLHLAVHFLKVSLTQKLLHKGAKTTLADSLGNTPLHWLTMNFSTNVLKSRKIGDMLLNCSEIKVNQKNYDNLTPLQLAIKFNSLDAFLYFLEFNQRIRMEVFFEEETGKLDCQSIRKLQNDSMQKAELKEQKKSTSEKGNEPSLAQRKQEQSYFSHQMEESDSLNIVSTPCSAKRVPNGLIKKKVMQFPEFERKSFTRSQFDFSVTDNQGNSLLHLAALVPNVHLISRLSSFEEFKMTPVFWENSNGKSFQQLVPTNLMASNKIAKKFERNEVFKGFCSFRATRKKHSFMDPAKSNEISCSLPGSPAKNINFCFDETNDIRNRMEQFSSVFSQGILNQKSLIASENISIHPVLMKKMKRVSHENTSRNFEDLRIQTQSNTVKEEACFSQVFDLIEAILAKQFYFSQIGFSLLKTQRKGTCSSEIKDFLNEEKTIQTAFMALVRIYQNTKWCQFHNGHSLAFYHIWFLNQATFFGFHTTSNKADSFKPKETSSRLHRVALLEFLKLKGAEANELSKFLGVKRNIFEFFRVK